MSSIEEKNIRLEHFFISESVWLRACSWNICNDSDEADELVAVTISKVVAMPENKLEKIYYGETSLNKNYIYNILKTTFLKKIRDNKFDFEDGHDFEETPDDSANEEREILQMKLIDSINEYLAFLLTQDRDWFSAKLFLLWHESGMTYQELADQTKISKGIVFETVKAMKAHLRERFEDQYRELEDL